jgi:hypothetical protein
MSNTFDMSSERTVDCPESSVTFIVDDNRKKLRSGLPWRRSPGRLTPSGIFRPPSSTGVRRFPLRFSIRYNEKSSASINEIFFEKQVPRRFFEMPAESTQILRTEENRKHLYINMESGSYVKKRNLTIKLLITEDNSTYKVGGAGSNDRDFWVKLFFVRYNLFSSNLRNNPEL